VPVNGSAAANLTVGMLLLPTCLQALCSFTRSCFAAAARMDLSAATVPATCTNPVAVFLVLLLLPTCLQALCSITRSCSAAAVWMARTAATVLATCTQTQLPCAYCCYCYCLPVCRRCAASFASALLLLCGWPALLPQS
jgi:hypothetical protein